MNFPLLQRGSASEQKAGAGIALPPPHGNQQHLQCSAMGMQRVCGFSCSLQLRYSSAEGRPGDCVPIKSGWLIKISSAGLEIN